MTFLMLILTLLLASIFLMLINWVLLLRQTNPSMSFKETLITYRKLILHHLLPFIIVSLILTFSLILILSLQPITVWHSLHFLS